MEFVPSNAFIIMGHGTEPKVTLEDEKKFIPCPCKITAKIPTIGSIINNKLMDPDLFFIVPDNCIIVVRAKPGERTHSRAIFSLLNKIGDDENKELYRNPLSNTKELIQQLGPVSIFKPGDKCPNFEYSLFFNRKDVDPTKRQTMSHLGVIKTPLKTPIRLVDNNVAETIVDTIDNMYSESVFPSKKTVNNTILTNIVKGTPTGEETVEDLLLLDNPEGLGVLDHIKYHLSTTQKQMLRIGEDGVAKRPGVYYNFVCRKTHTDYYTRLAYNYMDKVNPEITNIIKEDKNTVQLFKRILNETLRKRKPYVRNSYTVVGGKRRQWR